MDDVPELCQHMLREVQQRYNLPDRQLAPATLQAMCARRWPGNVRELRHLLVSAALTAEDVMILPGDLPPERSARDSTAGVEQPGVPAQDNHAVRIDSVHEALRATAGHHGRAAQLLGISRLTLYRYLHPHESGQPSRQRKLTGESEPELELPARVQQGQHVEEAVVVTVGAGRNG